MQIRTYKLLKWYPSLDRDWKVGMLVGQGDRNGNFANFSPCSSNYSDVQLPYWEVVNNQEFWQEIKEVKLDVSIGTKFTSVTKPYNIYQITEVEGDKVIFHLQGYVEGHDFLCTVEDVNKNFKTGNWIIYKELLFKDFLGNEVFEGDTFYFVNPMFWELEKGKAQYGDLRTEIHHFKNKVDAEKYITDNLPIYSKRQVLEALGYAQDWLQSEKMFKEKLGL